MPLQKYTVILLGILFSTLQFYAQKQNKVAIPSDSVKSTVLTPLKPTDKINLTDSLINYGKLFLNTPYRYGSEGISSFDCSGFTSYIYRNFGYNLERSSADQAAQFPSVDKSELKPGDLVFFNGRRRNGKVGHVGIVVAAKEDGEFDFIHASVKEGVTISNSQQNYYQKRFVKAARVIAGDSLMQIAVDNTTVKRQEYVSSIPSQPVKKVIPAKYHYVKAGENLSSIAEKYGLTVAQLKQKNKLKKDKLKIKQRLKITDEETILVVEPVLAKSSLKQMNDSSGFSENDKLLSNQNNSLLPTKHVVKKGETLFAVSKLYGISVKELKELNNLKKGKIFPGQELKLANETEPVIADNIKTANDNKQVANIQESAVKEMEHKVSKGETLASIAEKHNTTPKELMKVNNLTNAKILAGQVLKLPDETAQTSKEVAENQSEKISPNEPQKQNIAKITHKASSGESLFSISKMYNISIDELKSFNNLSSNNIQRGQTLQIPEGSSNSASKNAISAKTSITHKVSSGETLSSIAMKYDCTIKELKKWNNKTSDKLNLGDKLKVYSD